MKEVTTTHMRKVTADIIKSFLRISLAFQVLRYLFRGINFLQKAFKWPILIKRFNFIKTKFVIGKNLKIEGVQNQATLFINYNQYFTQQKATSSYMNYHFNTGQGQPTPKMDIKQHILAKSKPLLSFLKPNFSPEQPLKPKKIVEKANYHWTQEQHKMYIIFLAKNLEMFQLPYLQRMKLKIHVQMSKQIKTKTSSQCRSHHQKMLASYGSAQNLVTHFSQLLSIQLLSTQLLSTELKVKQKEVSQEGKRCTYKAELVLIEEEEVNYKVFF